MLAHIHCFLVIAAQDVILQKQHRTHLLNQHLQLLHLQCPLHIVILCCHRLLLTTTSLMPAESQTLLPNAWPHFRTLLVALPPSLLMLLRHGASTNQPFVVATTKIIGCRAILNDGCILSKKTNQKNFFHDPPTCSSGLPNTMRSWRQCFHHHGGTDGHCIPPCESLARTGPHSGFDFGIQLPNDFHCRYNAWSMDITNVLRKPGVLPKHLLGHATSSFRGCLSLLSVIDSTHPNMIEEGCLLCIHCLHQQDGQSAHEHHHAFNEIADLCNASKMLILKHRAMQVILLQMCCVQIVCLMRPVMIARKQPKPPIFILANHPTHLSIV